MHKFTTNLGWIIIVSSANSDPYFPANKILDFSTKEVVAEEGHCMCLTQYFLSIMVTQSRILLGPGDTHIKAGAMQAVPKS